MRFSTEMAVHLGNCTRQAQSNDGSLTGSHFQWPWKAGYDGPMLPTDLCT